MTKNVEKRIQGDLIGPNNQMLQLQDVLGVLNRCRVIGPHLMETNGPAYSNGHATEPPRGSCSAI